MGSDADVSSEADNTMTRWLAVVLAASAALATLAMGAERAAAQRAPVVVRVVVVDSAGAPVPGAAISLARGLEQVTAEGETDARGARVVRLVPIAASYEMIAQKIGYVRTSSFFAPTRDTMSVRLVLRRAVQTLAAVRVTEQEDIKRKAYFIDADQIANSSRPLFDAMDILTKLKPDMLYGRAPECGGTRNVFVNGKRIVYPAPNAMAQARRGIAPDPRMKTQSGRTMPAPKLQSTPEEVGAILAEIKPEHIAEMTFEDCFSTKVDGLHTQNALFVVLKPGIGFEDGRGSYVVEEKAPRSNAQAVAAVDSAPAPAPVGAYRARLLGVFDEMTGDPIDSVSVTDAQTGTSALTTKTGTVSLLFLPEGASTLKLAKPGYKELSLEVSISPRDTVPITLVLVKPR